MESPAGSEARKELGKVVEELAPLAFLETGVDWLALAEAERSSEGRSDDSQDGHGGIAGASILLERLKQ